MPPKKAKPGCKGAPAKAPKEQLVGKNKGKAVAESYLKQAVAKSLREQFQGFNDYEIDAKLVEGSTLRMQLHGDRKEYWSSSASKRVIVLGPAYYGELRRLFGDKTMIVDLLHWTKGLRGTSWSSLRLSCRRSTHSTMCTPCVRSSASG